MVDAVLDQFAVSNRIDNNKKEQAQRLTAMMVIHDIDESTERVKSLKDEMEAYVNSINKTGVALKEENLIGTWKLSSSDEREEECEYRKDHTYTVVGTQSGIANMPYAKGKLKANYTWEGEWKIEGDSLIQTLD